MYHDGPKKPIATPSNVLLAALQPISCCTIQATMLLATIHIAQGNRPTRDQQHQQKAQKHKSSCCSCAGSRGLARRSMARGGPGQPGSAVRQDAPQRTSAHALTTHVHIIARWGLRSSTCLPRPLACPSPRSKTARRLRRRGSADARYDAVHWQPMSSCGTGDSHQADDVYEQQRRTIATPGPVFQRMRPL